MRALFGISGFVACLLGASTAQASVPPAGWKPAVFEGPGRVCHTSWSFVLRDREHASYPWIGVPDRYYPFAQIAGPGFAAEWRVPHPQELKADAVLIEQFPDRIVYRLDQQRYLVRAETGGEAFLLVVKAAAPDVDVSRLALSATFEPFSPDTCLKPVNTPKRPS